MPSNNLRLNFSSLKIIHILHPIYHRKVIGHILKISQKASVSLFKRLHNNHNENEDENEN